MQLNVFYTILVKWLVGQGVRLYVRFIFIGNRNLTTTYHRAGDVKDKETMAKPHIILVHGMGEHEKDIFLETLFTPLDAASEHFSSLEKFSESVETHYIDYDAINHDVREYMKNATIDELATKYPGAPSLVAKINELNTKFAEDDSFWATHLLDVAIYRSYFSDAIQARVGKQIVEAMKAATEAGEEVHFVCHSLGTAVTHDTLHKLYVNSLYDEHGEPLLSAGLNKIGSISMIANVCQLPITESNPYTSVVKPGPDGICINFMTCRHVLDPIASLVKFNQAANWPLIQGSEFRNIAINKVERANVHDLDHYLADPRVYLPLFMNVFPKFKTNKDELAAAKLAYAQTTLHGKFEILRDYIEDADISLYWDEDEKEFVFSNDARNIYENITAFRDQLRAIEAQFSNLTGGNDDE